MLAIGFQRLSIPVPYNKYFQIVSNIEVNSKFYNTLITAMDLVINHEDFNNKLPLLTVFITDTPKFTISYEDNSLQYGSQFNAAVLLYNRLKTLNDLQILICIVEEFVHYFWLEQDELKTSNIVTSLVPGIACDNQGNYYLID